MDARDTPCVGKCLNQTTYALGISMFVGVGIALSGAHPSAVKSPWSLRYGKPLISPSRATPEYLPCIFIRALTAAVPWQHSWSAQILSVLPWAQGHLPVIMAACR